jgi:hypothetical protein
MFRFPYVRWLYLAGCTGLLAEWKRCCFTIDHKMVAVQGSLYLPTALSLSLYLSFYFRI